MEIGWHLRFCKDESLMFTVQQSSRELLYDVLTMQPNWSLDVEESGPDLLCAIYQRKKR